MSGATAQPGMRSAGLGAWIAAEPLRAVLAAIAVITLFSGAAQIPFGGTVLELLGAEPTPAAMQLFATVGMFMVVVGGLLLHTLLLSRAAHEVVLWSGIQKAGAFAAVGIGVVNGIFALVALAVAFFDLATAVLLFVYWRRLRESAVQPQKRTAGNGTGL